MPNKARGGGREAELPSHFSHGTGGVKAHLVGDSVDRWQHSPRMTPVFFFQKKKKSRLSHSFPMMDGRPFVIAGRTHRANQAVERESRQE